MGFAGQTRRAEGKAEVSATARLQFAVDFQRQLCLVPAQVHSGIERSCMPNKPFAHALCKQLRGARRHELYSGTPFTVIFVPSSHCIEALRGRACQISRSPMLIANEAPAGMRHELYSGPPFTVIFAQCEKSDQDHFFLHILCRLPGRRPRTQSSLYSR